MKALLALIALLLSLLSKHQPSIDVDALQHVSNGEVIPWD